MSKKWTVLLLLVTVIVLLIPCIYLSDIQVVEATYLKEKDYSQILEINGKIESAKTVPISLSYPVYIKECLVFENEYVNKGQLLFVLDLDKMEEAVKFNSLTGDVGLYNSLDKSRLADFSENIYASEAGFVTEIIAESGNLVLSDENLCVIRTQQEPMLKITLNQEDYQHISIGDVVEFSPVIMPSKKYYGYVCSKTAVIRKETSLTGSKTVIDIYATIENEDENIVNGLQFSGKIIKNDVKKIKILPYEYIGQDKEGEYVNVLKNNKVEKVYIETGIEDEAAAEIKTVFDNDTIFLKNDYYNKGKVLLKYDLE